MQLKNVLLSSLCCFSLVTTNAQVITIREARTKTLGTSVQLRGVVTNGDEIGTIRYIQDGTAGIGVFAMSAANLKRGDSIEVKGTLGHFNNLLQLSSNVTLSVLKSGVTLPQPIAFNGPLSGAFAKQYESMLVRINGVTGLQSLSGSTCGGAASLFGGNTNYCINSSSGTPLRVVNPANSAGDLIGKNVPTGSISVIGIVSLFNKGSFSGGTTTDPQYYDTTLINGYQLLTRLYEDLVLPPKPNILSDPKPVTIFEDNATKYTIWGYSVQVSFNTQNLGTTRFEYGLTPAFGNTIGDSNYSNTHGAMLNFLTPGTLYYLRGISANPNGVSVSRTVMIATKSKSSGEIRVYFNNPVDTSAATFQKAIYLDKTFDDTLVAYINKAKENIDFAIYNINPTGQTDIIAALNNAHTRGVKVRVVYEGGTANVGLNNLNPAIGAINRNTTTGIMHNKFMSIDAFAADPMQPWVWTGSTNLTANQIEKDNNQMFFIQDQSLAKAYVLETNEMFGSSGSQPDVNKSLFGPSKVDNTPHQFMIGNVGVEQYFSPSDRTTFRIIDAIKTANKDIFIQVMSFTRSDIATAIRNSIYAGAYGAAIMNDTGSGAAVNVYTTLAASNVMGNRVKVQTGGGIMHQKTGMIDANDCNSDPIVIAGSHNWSTAAENDNDENTLIIHDANITNQFYQQFSNAYQKMTGNKLKGFANFSYNNPMLSKYDFTDRSTLKATTWAWDFGDGGTSTLQNPQHNFWTNGTFIARLIASDGTNTDTAWASLSVNGNNGIYSNSHLPFSLLIYPNPTTSKFTIELPRSTVLILYDLQGKQLADWKLQNGLQEVSLPNLSTGIYILKTTEGIAAKLLIE
ncbi:MAG: T9SS type A sorting domain-containing protein [Flavobacteriaceae bacterium]|nr:T9SS type A sorting domain-containing protein [Flavobacteriaceae bacterium]